MKKSLFSLLIPLAVLTLAVFVVGPGNVGAQATSTPSITVLSPNGGEKWQVGSTQNITWKNSDLLNASNVQIGIRDVRYSTEGGERSETVIVYSVPNTGTYSWTIPRILTSPLGNTMDLTVTDNPVYKIAVSSWTSSTVGIGDVSDGPFSIVSSASTPCYTFTTNLRAGDSGNDVAALQKFLIAKGFDIPAISSGKVDPGYFGLATARALGNYQNSVGINEKLYGNAYFGPQTRASVNSSCSVVPAASSLILTSPNGGEVWNPNLQYEIHWKYGGALTGKEDMAISLVSSSGSICSLGGGPLYNGVFYTIPGSSGCTAGKYKAKIVVNTANGTIGDDSDNYFTITGINSQSSSQIISAVSPVALTSDTLTSFNVPAGTSRVFSFTTRMSGETGYVNRSQTLGEKEGIIIDLQPIPGLVAGDSANCLIVPADTSRNFNFTVNNVNNSYDRSIERVQSISGDCAPAKSGITITSPKDGEDWQVGMQYKIIWTDSREKGVPPQYVIGIAGSNGKELIAEKVSGTAYCQGMTCYYGWTPKTASTNNQITVYDVANDPNGTIVGRSYYFDINSGQPAITPCSIGPVSTTNPNATPKLFNVDFGKWYPSESNKKGPAIVGNSGDFWNVVGVAWCDNHNKANLKNADGSSSQVYVQMQNLGGSWGDSGMLGVRDPMLADFSYPASNKGGNAYVIVGNVPGGTYDLYLYNKTGNSEQNGDYTVTTADGNYGRKTMTTDADSYKSASWQENNQFVVFRSVKVSNGGKIAILIQPSVGGLHDAQISGLQLAPAGTPAAVVYTQYQGNPIIPPPPPQPAIVVLSPNGGETFSVSQPLTITFGNTQNNQRTYVNIVDSNNSGYDLISYNNYNFKNVSDPYESGGGKATVSLYAPKEWALSHGSYYKIEICSGNVCDRSDSYFTITPPTPAQPTITTPVIPTLTVTTSGDGEVRTSDGKYSCGGVCALPYNAGTRLTLSPMANKGSNFTGWSGGLCSGTGSCTITLNSDASVSATFAPIPATASPTISSFTASPSSITTGQYTTLSWSSVNASDCIIFGGGSTPVSGLPASGSRTVGPLSAASTYTLYCNGSNGQRAQANTSVTVKSPESPSKVTPVNTTSIWDSVSKYFPW